MWLLQVRSVTGPGNDLDPGPRHRRSHLGRQIPELRILLADDEESGRLHVAESVMEGFLSALSEPAE